MINTQTDIMNLFLPVNAGMPVEGAVIAGEESAKGQIQVGDFLKFLLGSIKADAEIIPGAPLTDADLPGDESIIEQVPTGSEESSDVVVMPNVHTPTDAVFGAVNLVSSVNPVPVQNDGRNTGPDAQVDIMPGATPVVDQDTKVTDTLRGKCIVSGNWQVERSNTAALFIESELPAKEEFTAGRIMNPARVFAGKESSVSNESYSLPKVNASGQIIISGQTSAGDIESTAEAMSALDQKLNRLADNLAVRMAEISQTPPERAARPLSVQVPDKAARPDMSVPTVASHKATWAKTSSPVDALQKAVQPEASLRSDVSQKPSRPEVSVSTGLSPKEVGPETFASADVSQEPLQPEIPPQTDDVPKTNQLRAAPLETPLIQNSGRDKADTLRSNTASSEPVESPVDDQEVVRPANDKASLETFKKDTKENSETIVSMKTSPQSSAESSRPVVYASAPTDKGDSATVRNDVPAVRFVLPDNVRETVMRPGNTITLRMEPEQLGSVRLTLTSHNDTLIGRIVVESSAAKMAVESNVHMLQNRLSDEGLHLEQFHVSVGGEQARQYAFGDGSQSNHAPAEQSRLSGATGYGAVAESPGTSSRRGGYVNAGGVNWLA